MEEQSSFATRVPDGFRPSVASPPATPRLSPRISDQALVAQVGQALASEFAPQIGDLQQRIDQGLVVLREVAQAEQISRAAHDATGAAIVQHNVRAQRLEQVADYHHATLGEATSAIAAQAEALDATRAAVANAEQTADSAFAEQNRLVMAAGSIAERAQSEIAEVRTAVEHMISSGQVTPRSDVTDQGMNQKLALLTQVLSSEREAQQQQMNELRALQAESREHIMQLSTSVNSLTDGFRRMQEMLQQQQWTQAQLVQQQADRLQNPPQPPASSHPPQPPASSRPQLHQQPPGIDVTFAQGPSTIDHESEQHPTPRSGTASGIAAPRTETIHAKESDIVKIPNLPEPPELKAFKRELRMEFVSASRRGDAAFAYITAVEKPGAKLEEFLLVVEPWTTIEAKLASGVMRAMKSKPLVGRKIAMKVDEAAKIGKMLPGRALLFLVYNEYRLDASVASLFGIEDVMELKLNGGDNSLAGFWEAWCDVELGLAEAQPERTMQHLLYKQIESLPCLQAQLAPYRIARHGDPLKTYAQLQKAASNRARQALAFWRRG